MSKSAEALPSNVAELVLSEQDDSLTKKSSPARATGAFLTMGLRVDSSFLLQDGTDMAVAKTRETTRRVESFIKQRIDFLHEDGSVCPFLLYHKIVCLNAHRYLLPYT